jgi:alkanesulfonate monooxygenase SsuD/methylene tetrahydromethanopterin reductase-like flavin-dependent oxidoreductase (luciferase family)
MASEMKSRVSVILDQVELPLGAIIERAGIAAKSGVDGLWLSQLPNQRDIALVLAAIAAHTPDVTLGPAVLPVYQSPPAVMAQTALTLDEVCGNRLILGLGRGHRLVGEWMLGGTYTTSTASMREYLSIVLSLIRDGEVNIAGADFESRVFYGAPRRPQLPVFVGAFGPRMVEVAAELADGVILWLCTPAYIRDVVAPSLRAGWARRPGGQAGFEVVAVMSAAASPQPAEDREHGRAMLSGYLRMENYKKVLTASGFGDDVRAMRPGDAMIDELCAIGSDQLIQDRMAAYREAGATEIALSTLAADRYLVPTIEAVLGS